MASVGFGFEGELQAEHKRGGHRRNDLAKLGFPRRSVVIETL
jgi:hypothetical protein